MNHNLIYNKNYYKSNYNFQELHKLSTIKKKVVLVFFSINTDSNICLKNNIITVKKYINYIYLKLIYYKSYKIIDCEENYNFTIKNINKLIKEQKIINLDYQLIPLLYLKNIYVVGVIFFNNKLEKPVDFTFNLLSKIKNDVYYPLQDTNMNKIITIKIDKQKLTLNLPSIFKLYYLYFLRLKIIRL